MSTPTLSRLLAAETRRQRGRFRLAGFLAALVAGASVLLLGLSGWFITAAALAGAAGAAAIAAFNYLLPSAGIRLLAILRTGSRYAERLVGHDAALRAMARLRPVLFAAMAAAPPGRALALSTGEASARLVQDVDAVEAGLVRRSHAWGAAAAFLSGLALLLLADPWPALAATALLILALGLADRLAQAFRAPGREVQRAHGALKEDFAALAAAAPELRAYGLEAWAAERLAARGAALAAAQVRVTAAAGWFELLQALAMGTAAFAALALSAEAPLPLAALAALGAAMMVDGAGPFLRGLERRGSLREAEARLEAMLAPAETPRPVGLLPQVAPCLALPHWPDPLPPGGIIGLVGPSGSGKTRLLESLLALRPVTPGHFALGGRDLAGLAPETIRASFSALPQDAALLAGTLRDNLRLAAPEADDATLRQALHDAGLAEVVAALPQGLDSWLGEDGARLSGGERRRLALARAYLRPAPWLLLDEPTESLDAATEALVLDRLRARLGRTGQGALIVTHRPAPLALCQRVLRLA